MERERIINIGPVCRFGPGGEYDTSWPAGDELVESADWANSYDKPKNALTRLLDVLAGLTEILRGPSRSIEITGPIEIDEVPNQRWLFADDWRAGAAVKHKPNHRIRAHRTVAKKRTFFIPAEGRTLFDADFKSAKTA